MYVSPVRGAVVDVHLDRTSDDGWCVHKIPRQLHAQQSISMWPKTSVFKFRDLAREDKQFVQEVCSFSSRLMSVLTVSYLWSSFFNYKVLLSNISLLLIQTSLKSVHKNIKINALNNCPKGKSCAKTPSQQYRQYTWKRCTIHHNTTNIKSRTIKQK